MNKYSYSKPKQSSFINSLNIQLFLQKAFNHVLDVGSGVMHSVINFPAYSKTKKENPYHFVPVTFEKKDLRSSSLPEDPKVFSPYQPLKGNELVTSALGSEKKHVLIADQNIINAQRIATILNKHQIPYIFAYSYNDIKTKLRSRNIGLTFIGVYPEDGRGSISFSRSQILALKEIKRAGNNSSIVAITTILRKNEKSTCLQNGFDKVLVSPYLENDLVTLIYNHLKISPKQTHQKSALTYTFDLKKLTEIKNKNEKSILSTLEKMVVSITLCSQNIIEALNTENYDQLRKAAQRNISTYTLIGLEEACTITRAIIDCINVNPDKEKIYLLIDSLNQNNSQLVCDLLNYIQILKQKRA